MGSTKVNLGLDRRLAQPKHTRWLRHSLTIELADAHGVALLDSSGDSFYYRRGDRFWICIGAHNRDDGTSVPVINLRTFERGSIETHHVCWFPKIRGPNQSLWTLGGETRKLKLDGSRRFSLLVVGNFSAARWIKANSSTSLNTNQRLQHGRQS